MCDTIGKILPNGKALFGKNSDRSPNEPQVIYFYPAAHHSEKTVKTTYIEVDQVPETKAILLSRPTWLWGGEMGVNECGVCIGNEAVFTKVKYEKTGLTGMDMLRLALERSENAKTALTCIISLLQQYGQGGNCGYDHNFYYDNSFLIMDGKEIYILETAGKEWVFKKTHCGAISNRLSIHEEGMIYSEGSCDFVQEHLEPVYSYFSQSKCRKSICDSAIKNASCIEDIFSTLRQHAHDKNPLCKASVGSPCMHYGGLVGDHTTQSLVVEWDENGKMVLWTTGRSMPCVSLFKPFTFGSTISPINDPLYWLEAESVNRKLLGHKLPNEYYAERDSLESEFINKSKDISCTQMDMLSKFALEKEIEFIAKWQKTELAKEKVSALFKQNWKKKNNVFKRIKRITEMELYYDVLQAEYDNSNPIHQEMLQKLISYYESPEWHLDYESDERGELPQRLKRGVLSQDGLYNFLMQVRQL